LIRFSLLGAIALAAAVPAAAEDNHLELWLNPSLVKDLDDKTFVEFETQQRFREAPAGDTYAFRLWLGREIGEGVTVSGALDRRKEGSTRETRLIQQIGYPLIAGLKGRTRLEQRFLNDNPRTAWRLRQRIGAGLPLSGQENGWTLAANAEGFFTIRAGEPGGQTGLTGLRTFVGVEREFERIELSLGYTRQQNIRRNAPDRVGHAPTIALTFKL
jgi:hypothetical protein